MDSHSNLIMLISFEGPEASGKSTQVKLFSQYTNTPVFREPGFTQLGERVRSLVKDPNLAVCPKSELLLFLTARAQLLTEIDLTKLVILDRFIDSTYVYQGIVRGLGLETCINLNDFATSGIVPDLTFYIRVPVNVTLERLSSRNEAPDKFDEYKETFHHKVLEGYDLLATRFKRIHVIDGTKSVEHVHEEIISVFESNRQ